MAVQSGGWYSPGALKVRAWVGLVGFGFSVAVGWKGGSRHIVAGTK